MRAIPIVRCFNMRVSINFYTNTLDFELVDPTASADDSVLDLACGSVVLRLTALEGDQKSGVNFYFEVDDVDELFNRYISRGLQVPHRPESPVHNGPVDQTWGMREFYVDDPSGNTLRFGQIMKRST